VAAGLRRFFFLFATRGYPVVGGAEGIGSGS
jgi:hypothetical protein